MEIKSKITKENFLAFGTCRIVFDLGDGTVLKIPYNNLGIEANKLEYEYSKGKTDIAAEIYMYENNLIIQEKLDNIVTVPYEHTINGTIREYLNEQGLVVEDKLIDEMLKTRMQIGTDANGKYKFFDYEDAKISHRSILEPFKMDEKWLPAFLDYINEYGVENIREWETFEDHRGFLVEYEDE